MGKQNKLLITASSMACLFSCARKYYLSYEIGWRKRTADDSLRFGTAFHKGLEVWFENKQPGGCGCSVGDAEGSESPLPEVRALEAALATAGEEEFDAETAAQLTALLGGYFSKWGLEKFAVEPEREFAVKFPFLRGVVVCGKMDGVVTLENGVKCLIEHKTTSEDIGALSDYWQTINRDQVALYRAAAEKEGLKLESVIYDVIRKPTIHCGKEESAKDYESRLAADCVGAQEGDNPRAKGYKRGSDFYFARREIPLLDCDMDKLARRLFAARSLVKNYRKLQKVFGESGAAEIEAWPKCGSTMVCRFCAFRGVCDNAELPETEWERGRAHEELEIAKKYM